MSESWRGSYGRGQRVTMARQSRMFHSPSKSLPPPLSSQTKIQEIRTASELPATDNAKPVITNVKLVGSFSWKDSVTPVVMVPGRPPKWQPPNETRTLKEDNGIYYHDSNSARYPSFPMEPSIRSIEKNDPAFSFMDVDLVTCDHCLVRLFAFVRAEELTFRFGVELIGSTLFLVRKTNLPKETIDNIYGFGQSFPGAYTTWDKDVRGSSKNQRLLEYDFAGLNCIVRFGADGYLPEKLESSPTSTVVKEIEDDLELDKIGMLRLLAATPETSGTLEVHEAGELVPQEAVFDLKTRSMSKAKTISIQNFLHNLWVNQVPNFILAFHEKGKFRATDIHVINAREQVQEWESENAKHLKELSQVLHKLISISQTAGRNTFEIRREGNGPLQVWTETTEWSALPSSMRSLFVTEVPTSDSCKERSHFNGSEADPDDWLKL